MRHYDAPLCGAIAAVLLSMLLIAPLVRIFAMLLVSVLLIMLLVLMGRAWHNDHVLIYDAVIIGGAFLTLVYMFSFMVLQDTLLARATLLVFAAFYVVMTVVLARHEHDNARNISTRTPTIRKDREHAHKQRFLSHVFFRNRSRDHAHDPTFQQGLAPIPDVDKREHEEQVFKKGVEPLHELHPTHPGILHPKMELYDLEAELKQIEKKTKKKR